MPNSDSFGGRLQNDFTGLMTALPDHTSKAFHNLGQSTQAIAKYAEETQNDTKDTLDNLETISHGLAKLRNHTLPIVSMRTQVPIPP
ncbi:hypothetical protein Unana1_04896 [Umbelopsis nana]